MNDEYSISNVTITTPHKVLKNASICLSEGRIKDLIPQGYIDIMTRLVLTNTIYFKAAWGKPFAEDGTRSGAFELLDGTRVQVDMMMMTFLKNP